MQVYIYVHTVLSMCVFVYMLVQIHCCVQPCVCVTLCGLCCDMHTMHIAGMCAVHYSLLCSSCHLSQVSSSDEGRVKVAQSATDHLTSTDTASLVGTSLFIPILIAVSVGAIDLVLAVSAEASPQDHGKLGFRSSSPSLLRSHHLQFTLH